MRQNTKQAKICNIMNNNPTTPMDEVLSIICAELGIERVQAKNYYLWAIRSGLAQGAVVYQKRGPKGGKRKPKNETANIPTLINMKDAEQKVAASLQTETIRDENDFPEFLLKSDVKILTA